MGDGNYLARYSFLPQGIPVSFHVQREGQLPKGLLLGFFFFTPVIQSVAQPTLQNHN